MLRIAGTGAAQGQQGQEPAAPAGPNTQPLDMFNPQVSAFLSMHESFKALPYWI